MFCMFGRVLCWGWPCTWARRSRGSLLQEHLVASPGHQAVEHVHRVVARALEYEPGEGVLLSLLLLLILLLPLPQPIPLVIGTRSVPTMTVKILTLFTEK